MNTVTLGLAFRRNSGTLPAAAAIHLKFFSKSGNQFGPVNLNLLTPECRGPEELESWIDRLHRELDVIKTEARKRFQRERPRP